MGLLSNRSQRTVLEIDPADKLVYAQDCSPAQEVRDRLPHSTFTYEQLILTRPLIFQPLPLGFQRLQQRGDLLCPFA